MTALASVTSFRNLDPDLAVTNRLRIEGTEYLLAAARAASDLAGVVLRYGSFYGPGTSLAPGGSVVEAVRKRRLPIIGEGSGVWSFVHIADVGEATRLAVENGPSGLYTVVDDDPAAMSVWIPELARLVGASLPYRIPGRDPAAWRRTAGPSSTSPARGLRRPRRPRGAARPFHTGPAGAGASVPRTRAGPWTPAESRACASRRALPPSASSCLTCT
jgi:nucleoside-diphosphate-sugar epimerase